MAISFNQVPNGGRVPFVFIEFDNTGAVTGTSIQPYKGLLLGQRTSAGTVAALTPTLLTSEAQAKTAFGAGSMLHNMAEAWFAQNKFTPLLAVAISDGGSDVAATGSIVITATPTAAGTLAVYIAGRKVTAGVTTSSTATTIAAALRDAINAATSLPVTATASTGTVTVTAKNKGLTGNGIDIRLNYNSGDATPAGVSAAITAMSGGTGVPDLSTVWAVIPNDQYNVLANPYTDSASLASIEAEMLDRGGPLRQQDGVVFAAVAGNLSAGTTLGLARNNQFCSLMPTNGSPTPVWELAAENAAIVGYYGQIDPARPFKTLAYKWFKSGVSTSRFTFSERNILLNSGCSTYVVGADGVPQVERLITTYQTNPLGAPDVSYLDVNTMLTLSYLRYDTRNLLLTKYPRHKLASDGTRYGVGQAMVTPKTVKAELIARARQWEELGLVENADVFKSGLIVERNAQDANRLDILMTPDLVNQLQVMAVQNKFILQ